MEIDWSKAPVWANAVIASQDGQEFYVSQWGGISARQRIGYSWADSDASADMIEPHDWVLVTTRQGEWAGEGLPPVGTVCEAGIQHVSGPNNETRSVIWIEGHVIAYHAIKDKTYAWFAEDDGFYPPGVFEFRPIRTPEQIAAEERDAASIELAGILSGHDQHIAVRDIEMAKYLYDAGYRKQVQP